MVDLTADVDAVARRHGAPAGTFAAEMERLAPLIDDGIRAVAESRVTVTEKGRPLVRSVAAAFDAYLNGGRQRHSGAVWAKNSERPRFATVSCAQGSARRRWAPG